MRLLGQFLHVPPLVATATQPIDLQPVGFLIAHAMMGVRNDPDDPAEQARARSLQIRDERCEAAIYDLRRLERPESRTTRDDLERQRYAVWALCGY